MQSPPTFGSYFPDRSDSTVLEFPRTQINSRPFNSTEQHKHNSEVTQSRTCQTLLMNATAGTMGADVNAAIEDMSNIFSGITNNGLSF